MNAAIIQTARPGERPAIIQIDGVNWESPLPNNSGEAQSYNEDAERILEAVRGK